MWVDQEVGHVGKPKPGSTVSLEGVVESARRMRERDGVKVSKLPSEQRKQMNNDDDRMPAGQGKKFRSSDAYLMVPRLVKW